MNITEKKQITIAVLLSLLFHILLLIVSYIYLDRSPYTPPDEEIIQIDLRNDDWKIADITPPQVERIPDKAKHLGMYNSKVEEETVASQFPRAPGRPVTRGGEGAEKMKEKLNGYQKAEKFAEPGPKDIEVGDLMNKMPEDFYPDYKRGPHTYLNVLKHPDVGYFVMLKRVFKLAWDPTSVLRYRMMNGEISRGSIKVVLGLAISAEGNMNELFVINSSGMDDYDQEALRAVRASAPFGKPPRKLLANDNILRLSWTFVVYM